MTNVPTTLTQKVDRYVEELASDPKLLSAVLDGLIEKRATDEIPKKVQEIALSIEKETGATKEAALKMAFETYVRYVNPEYLAKLGKKGLPPWLKKTDKDGKEKGKDKKAPPFMKKKSASGLQTKEARDLARALGM